MKWRNINWVYVLSIGTIIFVLPKIKSKLQNFDECFGIAENQIRTYSRPEDVLVKEIKVRLGQAVERGDTLMIFHPQNLFYKKEDFSSQSRLLDINKQVDLLQIQQSIQRLEQQKEITQGNYEIKVQTLNDQKRLADSLALLVTNQPVSSQKYDLQKTAWEATLRLDLREIDLQIAQLKNELKTAPATHIEKQSNLSAEISRLQSKEKELVLISDMDGIVGVLDAQPGDPIAAYQSLVKLYSTHPNLVTTYISENYIGAIDIRDTVIVQSLSGYRITGKVLNLGVRVTALPDRLKKIPEIKSWGREVQIEIPLENQLIQGEKVNVIFPGLKATWR